MRLISCDKCGMTQKLRGADFALYWSGVQIHDTNISGKYEGGTDYDICKSCTQSLKQFIEPK